MNLPTDKIHCIDWGYGWLLFPIWWNKWLCLREPYKKAITRSKRFRIANRDRFHNCRVTGIY